MWTLDHTVLSANASRSMVGKIAADEDSPVRGKVQISYASNETASDSVPQVWLETFKRPDYMMDDDSFPGAGQGAFSSLSSIDPNSAARSYSANAYYQSSTARQLPKHRSSRPLHAIISRSRPHPIIRSSHSTNHRL